MKSNKTKKIVLVVIASLSFANLINGQNKTGINTTVPEKALHVVPDVAGNDPVKIVGLNSGDPDNDLLTIDANGVVKRNAAVKGILLGSFFSEGTTPTIIGRGLTANIDGVSITITPEKDATALITVSTLGLPETPGFNVQGTVNLLQNGVKISSQYYASWDGQDLSTLGNYVTITRSVNLNEGVTYTFTLQAKCWIGTTIFNRNPFPSYGGSEASDTDSMKSNMTILLYSN